MCSTPPPIATSWTPEATSAAAKLIACWADPHWRSIVVGGSLDGQAGLEPGVAADVECLLAELLDAAGHDVLDLGRVDPGAVDELGVGLREEVGRVGVLVDALLRMTAADRGANRLDDHYLAALELAVSVAGHLRLLGGGAAIGVRARTILEPTDRSVNCWSRKNDANGARRSSPIGAAAGTPDSAST